MPVRDPLELKRHAPTIPSDLNDPPRFGQITETPADALKIEVSAFFANSGFTSERRQELPTVEKYSNFGEGLDPYETFVKITEIFPDVTERLPHVAITTQSGRNRRMTFGRPMIAHTQAPPRVVTANPGPYALGNPTAQVSTLSLTAAPGTYVVVLEGTTVTTTVAGSNLADAASALARDLRGATGLVFLISSAGAVVTIRSRTLGVAFAIAAVGALTVATPSAAGTALTPDVLAFRTFPGGRGNPITSAISFPRSRFSTTENMAALSATAIARVFNEQALYAYARPVAAGLQLETGGRFGGKSPNEIEILSTSTPALVAALGLANSGTAGAGASIAGTRPTMTVTVAGTPFTAAMIGRYLVLGGATSPSNSGRFRISAVPTSNQLVITNEAGTAEALPTGAAWFIGFRDDTTNPLRPVMNRYHMAMELQVTVDILAEGPNERREMLDLVLSQFMFFLEQKHFTLYGRGIFDPDGFPDEHYQISIHQEIVDGGETDFPRGEDQKKRIHAGRVVIPVTCIQYIDRLVTVPSGPSAGQSWTLESANISEDDSLPSSS